MDKTPDNLLVNSKNYNDGNAANGTNDVTITGSNSYLKKFPVIRASILGGTVFCYQKHTK